MLIDTLINLNKVGVDFFGPQFVANFFCDYSCGLVGIFLISRGSLYIGEQT